MAVSVAGGDSNAMAADTPTKKEFFEKSGHAKTDRSCEEAFAAYLFVLATRSDEESYS